MHSICSREQMNSGRGGFPQNGSTMRLLSALYTKNTFERGSGVMLLLEPCITLQSKMITEPGFAIAPRPDRAVHVAGEDTVIRHTVFLLLERSFGVVVRRLTGAHGVGLVRAGHQHQGTVIGRVLDQRDRHAMGS